MINYRMGIVIGIGALSLAGCGVRQYRRLPLRPVSEKRAHVVRQQGGVKVCVRKLTRDDLKTVFDGRTLARNSKISCLAVTIDNQRAESIFLDPERVLVKLISVKDMAELLGPHACGDSAVVFIAAGGFALCALVATPVALIAAAYGSLTPCLFPVAFGISSGVVGASGVCKFKDLKTYNQVLNEDLQEKMLHKPLLIAAHEQKTILLFVREMPKKIVLALRDNAAHSDISFSL